MPTIDPGGILDHAMPLPASRVMVVCGHCDRPTRIAHREARQRRQRAGVQALREPLEVQS